MSTDKGTNDVTDDITYSEMKISHRRQQPVKQSGGKFLLFFSNLGCSRKHHCVCCDALLNMFPVPAAEAGNIWHDCCQCNKGKEFIELPQILK